MKTEYEQITLYNGTAPGSQNLDMEEVWTKVEATEGKKEKLLVEHVIIPSIYPFLTEQVGKKTEKMPAILVVPGGAFRRLVINSEGFEIAEWLKKQGFQAFVLKCRLPSEAHENRSDVALMDAQRAIRMIRSRADEWNIDENRIGIMGFSAGGGIASMLATCFDRQVYAPADDMDMISARPDFCVLCYPAICAEVEITSILCKVMGEQMANVPVHRIQNAEGTVSFEVGGKILSTQMMEQYKVPSYLIDFSSKYSTDRLVTGNTPKTFIMETDLDKTTRAEHSIRYYLACRRARVSAELHIFSTGTHGFGLGQDDEMSQTGQWKSLFLKWAKVQRII